MVRCEMEYKVDGEVIPMVGSYKYLGCAVDEHLELKDMVQGYCWDEGSRGLAEQGYRLEVGDAGLGTFRKLMSTLVDSTMLYSAEIWCCTKKLEAIEEVQMSAFQMFFGVGTLHASKGLIIHRDGLSTSSVGGKSEVCAV